MEPLTYHGCLLIWVNPVLLRPLYTMSIRSSFGHTFLRRKKVEDCLRVGIGANYFRWDKLQYLVQKSTWYVLSIRGQRRHFVTAGTEGTVGKSAEKRVHTNVE